MQAPAMPWLPLRQELNLFPGPNDHHGAPTWVLQDPASQRFFRFDWPGFEMLRRWSLGDPAAIAQAVSRDTTLNLSAEDVTEFQQRLYRWELLQVSAAVLRQHWSQRPEAPGGWRWLLQHYLFIRIPLIRPQPWLERWGDQLGFLFGRGFWSLTVLAGVLGLYLTVQQWTPFWSTFAEYADWRGALYLFLALAVVKILHEFGHAITTHRFGCRVATMGIAFLVLWPVLYTDTSETWTLRSRRQRLCVGAAGMLAELAIAAWATLAWHLAPDGPLRTALFFLATTAWVMSLIVNLNPFMRFDGYFLLCDGLNRPNLHARAFEFGRWWLRTRLWGIPAEPPESLPAGEQRAMILFAFGTWIYRFFLFLGIALLVYHLFFKALGILLMVVELVVFIVRPIWRELQAWWQQRRQMQGWRRVQTLLVLGLLLLPLFIPWSSTLRVPATHGALVERELFVPRAAQLAD
ncbi:MAG: peptidase M50, partial [Gammaproteobacteria bacterium]|nr:peptidase M50 [Gammaproteobacteria bacterium]